MASFLDNSGDIILDAVLTEVGRQRLAEVAKNGGNAARIRAFAIGDDEINYSQYELNNPSGSNYADLQILQTPILEAFTMGNAAINYGLLKIQNKNLLYLPGLKINEKPAANTFPALTCFTNGLFYWAANQTTYDALVGGPGVGENMSADQVGKAYDSLVGPFLFVEGGFESSELAKDQSNRAGYILNNGLSNTSYNVGLDNRITSQVLTSTSTGVFANGISKNQDKRGGWSVTSKRPLPKATQGVNVANIDFFSAPAVSNNVVNPDSGGSATTYSAFEGPGDSIAAFKFTIKQGLQTDAMAGGTRDTLYTQIGMINQSAADTIPGSGSPSTYDFIDTLGYVYGTKTGGAIQVPIRIVRKVT